MFSLPYGHLQRFSPEWSNVVAFGGTAFTLKIHEKLFWNIQRGDNAAAAATAVLIAKKAQWDAC